MMWIALGIGFPVVSYGLYGIYMRFVKAVCHCKADLTGKTAIITGSDKGRNCKKLLSDLLCKLTACSAQNYKKR